MDTGKLFLLPAPLGSESLHTIPDYALSIMHQLRFFVAERARTTRRYLKASGYPLPLPVAHIEELNKDTPDEAVPGLLKPAMEGNDIGLMSEAGCPGIADPGARLVEAAHRAGLEVIPLVGPSSIFLALMASGMGGQHFAFHGYLSPKRPLLAKDLKRLEQLARSTGSTQIFMETPYRNQAVLEEAILNLAGNTRFALATDLTLPSQFIRSQPINHWKKGTLPNLHKRPTIFLIAP